MAFSEGTPGFTYTSFFFLFFTTTPKQYIIHSKEETQMYSILTSADRK